MAEKSGQMAFQTRANLQIQAIGWPRKGCGSLGGGAVLRFLRIGIWGTSLAAAASELGWCLGALLTDRRSATHDIREVRPQWFQVTNTP